MSIKIIFNEFNEDEETLRFYVSASPMDSNNLPTPVDETGGSSTLTPEPDYGPDAVSHTVSWNEQIDAYVRVSAVRSGIESVSDEWYYEHADIANAQPGDLVGGGVYAGIDTIGGTDYHIVAGDAASEEYGLQWKTSRTTTADTSSTTDGLANTQAMEAAGIADHPAAAYCLAYTGGGHNDWHMPASSQLTLMYNNLRMHAEFATNVSSEIYTWSSTGSSSQRATVRNFSDGNESYGYKDYTDRLVRPVRRVPV